MVPAEAPGFDVGEDTVNLWQVQIDRPSQARVLLSFCQASSRLSLHFGDIGRLETAVIWYWSITTLEEHLGTRILIPIIQVW